MPQKKSLKDEVAARRKAEIKKRADDARKLGEETAKARKQAADSVQRPPKGASLSQKEAIAKKRMELARQAESKVRKKKGY